MKKKTVIYQIIIKKILMKIVTLTRQLKDDDNAFLAKYDDDGNYIV